MLACGERLSVKLRQISFVALLCVILGHVASNNEVILRVFCQWHVPWFFFLSWMMLALSLSKQSAGTVFRKKLRTLVLPYFAWCVLGGLITFWHERFALDVVKIFALNGIFPSGNLNLWYLHSLIVFVMVAILQSKFLPAWRIPGLLLYGVVFLAFELCNLSVFYGTPTSPFYFIAGHFLARFILTEGASRSQSRSGVFAATFLVAVALRCLNFCHPSALIKTLAIVTQIASIWYGYDIVDSWLNISRFKSSLFSFVFFVYCLHGPLLIYAKEIWLRCVAPDISLIGIGVIFVVTTCVTLGLAKCVNVLSPRLYAILSGGR